MPCDIETRIRWGNLLWIAAITMVVLSVAITWDAWFEAFSVGWKDEETGYVILAPIVIVWLAWVRRGRLAYCRVGGNFWGVVAIAAGWLMWTLGHRLSIPTFWFAGPVVVAVGSLICVVGRDVFLKFLPAFIAMLFLVPLTPTRRQIIAAPLQTVTARYTRGACELIGMRVERNGNVLRINGTAVEVVEACNGMRMAVTLFLVCYVLAFGTAFRWYVRLLLLAAAPVVAIVCNVIRLVPTVWMYGDGATETALRFHDIAGWAMLIVAFLMLRGSVGLLRWLMIPVSNYPIAG